MKLTKIEIDTFRRCIMRELKFRKNFYPKWVEKGKMKQEQADIEIATMEKIKEYFDYLEFNAPEEQTQKQLFDTKPFEQKSKISMYDGY